MTEVDYSADEVISFTVPASIVLPFAKVQGSIIVIVYV